jgi:hypothetical protein
MILFHVPLKLETFFAEPGLIPGFLKEITGFERIPCVTMLPSLRQLSLTAAPVLQ